MVLREQFTLITLVVLALTCVGCASRETKTLDSQAIPPGHGVVVTRLHSTWPGYWTWEGLTAVYGVAGQPDMTAPQGIFTVTLSPEVRANTVPSGDYEWWYFLVWNCHYGLVNMPFRAEPNKIIYIGDLYFDVKQEGLLFSAQVVFKDQFESVQENFQQKYPSLYAKYGLEKRLTNVAHASWKSDLGTKLIRGEGFNCHKIGQPGKE